MGVPMTTERQIAANRQNAQRSTGPVTQAGKSLSRRNSQTHGLSSTTLMLIVGEDPELLSELQQALIAKFSPQDVLETYLVELLAGTIWRLKRASSFEAVLIEWKKHKQRMEDNDPRRKALLDIVNGKVGELDPIDEKNRVLGRALESALIHGDPLEKLSRHEAHLARQAERLFDRLNKLKSERSAAAA
jgi:hypothetical protein